MDWELIAIFLISFPFQLFLVLKIRKQQVSKLRNRRALRL